MVERFKTAPWKGVGPQKGSVGSNPTSTATLGDIMQKLLRCKKVFGRCKIHGSNCGVAEEIQSIPITRAKEKADLRKEIKEQLED